MPRGSPFTALCQAAARLTQPITVDLHLHTTASDGDATPGQLVAAALRRKLHVIAVTDHDTLAGVAPAQEAARQFPPGRLRIINGVEISTRFDDQELHLLGLFINPAERSLAALLAGIRSSRADRFHDYLRQIPELGPATELGLARVMATSTSSLGRRHIAKLLVQAGVAATIPEAFRRYIIPVTARVIPKRMPSIEEAIACVHDADGIAVLAHPPEAWTRNEFSRLREFGLDGIEAIFPAASPLRSQMLRCLAQELGCAITGGSDSHDPVSRSPGSFGLTWADFQCLEDRIVSATSENGHNR